MQFSVLEGLRSKVTAFSLKKYVLYLDPPTYPIRAPVDATRREGPGKVQMRDLGLRSLVNNRSLIKECINQGSCRTKFDMYMDTWAYFQYKKILAYSYFNKNPETRIVRLKSEGLWLKVLGLSFLWGVTNSCFIYGV